MTIIDIFLHKHPKLYRIKITYIYKLKQKIYKNYGILKKQNELASKLNEDFQNILAHYCRNKNILEIGSGRGEDLIMLSKKYNSICTGIDIRKEMINFGKMFYGIDQLVQGSCEYLPFRSDAFDVSLMSNLIHHLPLQIRQRTIKEALRVAPVLVIFDNGNVEKGLYKMLLSLWWKVTDGSIKNCTLEDWKKLLRDCQILEMSFPSYLFMRHCYFVVTRKQ